MYLTGMENPDVENLNVVFTDTEKPDMENLNLDFPSSDFPDMENLIVVKSTYYRGLSLKNFLKKDLTKYYKGVNLICSQKETLFKKVTESKED